MKLFITLLWHFWHSHCNCNSFICKVFFQLCTHAHTHKQTNRLFYIVLLHRCPWPPKTPPHTFDLPHTMVCATSNVEKSLRHTWKERKKKIFLSFHIIVLLCSAAPYEICPEDYAVSMVWRRTPSGELAFNRCPPNATGTDMSNDSRSVRHTGLVFSSP